MAANNGHGVDLVLNSLSGELLHVSWNCVAPFGKMLEIGKRDFIGRGLLSMDNFESNRSFHGIDMSQMAVVRPKICQKYDKDLLHSAFELTVNCLGSLHNSIIILSEVT